jgi:hypothetical protein
MGINTIQDIKKSFGSNPLLRELSSVNVVSEKFEGIGKDS